jgi:hypothetical protein
MSVRYLQTSTPVYNIDLVIRSETNWSISRSRSASALPRPHLVTLIVLMLIIDRSSVPSPYAIAVLRARIFGGPCDTAWPWNAPLGARIGKQVILKRAPSIIQARRESDHPRGAPPRSVTVVSTQT